MVPILNSSHFRGGGSTTVRCWGALVQQGIYCTMYIFCTALACAPFIHHRPPHASNGWTASRRGSIPMHAVASTTSEEGLRCHGICCLEEQCFVRNGPYATTVVPNMAALASSSCCSWNRGAVTHLLRSDRGNSVAGLIDELSF